MVSTRDALAERMQNVRKTASLLMMDDIEYGRKRLLTQLEPVFHLTG